MRNEALPRLPIRRSKAIERTTIATEDILRRHPIVLVLLLDLLFPPAFFACGFSAIFLSPRPASLQSR